MFDIRTKRKKWPGRRWQECGKMARISSPTEFRRVSFLAPTDRRRFRGFLFPRNNLKRALLQNNKTSFIIIFAGVNHTMYDTTIQPTTTNNHFIFYFESKLLHRICRISTVLIVISSTNLQSTFATLPLKKHGNLAYHHHQDGSPRRHRSANNDDDHQPTPSDEHCIVRSRQCGGLSPGLLHPRRTAQ